MNAKEVIQYMITNNCWADTATISKIVEKTIVDKWFCPACGVVRELFTDKIAGARLGRTCGQKKCHPALGTSRPDHSAYMKALAAAGTNPTYNSSLMKKGHLHNKNVNTPEFFVKVLENKGIAATADDWQGKLHDMLSVRNKDRDNRTKTIVTKFNQWSVDIKLEIASKLGLTITSSNLAALSDAEFSVVYKVLHGIQSTMNMENLKTTGQNNWFKHVLIINPKFNLDGEKEITTRSGTEARYIELFEESCIYWRYEPFRIPRKDGGYYLPDFFILYNGRSIIVEVKGNYYRSTEAEFIHTRGIPATAFAKSRGWEYCITTDGNPKSMDFLNDALYLEMETTK